MLARFQPKIVQEDYQLIFVLNANRPEVRDAESAAAYLRSIEAVTGLTCSGLVNNTHLCGETTPAEIRKGAAPGTRGFPADRNPDPLPHGGAAVLRIPVRPGGTRVPHCHQYEKAVGALTPRQEKRRHPATMTAKVTFNSDRCKGCELCTTVCPKHIVAIDQAVINRKGYHPAHVTDISQCIACASCAKICPDSIITVEKF